MVLVLLSLHAKRLSVSLMGDFFLSLDLCKDKTVKFFAKQKKGVITVSIKRVVKVVQFGTFLKPAVITNALCLIHLSLV